MDFEKQQNTPTGVWFNGILLLLNEGFTGDEVSILSGRTSEFMEAMLQCYKANRTDEIITQSIQDWFEGIVLLKRQGYHVGEIMDILDDIYDAYYYAEYIRISGDYEDDDDDEFYDDDDEKNDGFFNDDDNDEDDEDDDDFDPRKFFPKK